MLNLKTILLANAASCILFGALFAIIPSFIATYVGTVPVLVVMIIGLLLIGNGFFLIFTAFKESPSFSDILTFSVGDFIWVAATLVFILSDTWITTQNGIIASLLIAIMVGFFGVMQLALRPKVAS